MVQKKKIIILMADKRQAFNEENMKKKKKTKHNRYTDLSDENNLKRSMVKNLIKF